jgi:hypothetical protein
MRAAKFMRLTVPRSGHRLAVRVVSQEMFTRFRTRSQVQSLNRRRRVGRFVHLAAGHRPLAVSAENSVRKTENKMQWRVRMAVLYVIGAGVALTGCASGGTRERQPTLMEQCQAKATSKNEHSQCTFENQKRMQGGRGYGSS